MISFRKLRQLRGLSIEKAARTIGVTSQTWWKWEVERSKPNEMSKRALADAFAPELEQLRPAWYLKLLREGYIPRRGRSSSSS